MGHLEGAQELTGKRVAQVVEMQVVDQGQRQVELQVWMEEHRGQSFWPLLGEGTLVDQAVEELVRPRPIACGHPFAQSHVHTCRYEMVQHQDQHQSENHSCVGPTHVRVDGPVACHSRRRSSKGRLGGHDGCAKRNGDTRKENENVAWLARVHGFCTRTRNHAYWCGIDDERKRRSDDSLDDHRSRSSW